MILYGRNPVKEAIIANQKIEKIYIQYGSQGAGIDEIYTHAKKNHIPISTMDKRKFIDFAKTNGINIDSSQGVIAFTPLVKFLTLEELITLSFESESKTIVAVDGITDPQNLGAIIRTIECSGAIGLILPESNSSPINPTVAKASAGALAHCTIAKVHSLPIALKDIANAGFKIIGTDASSTTMYNQIDYSEPHCIIIGSEGFGMQSQVKKQCTQLVSLPLKGKVDSLNASVTAGIMLYEVLRQKG